MEIWHCHTKIESFREIGFMGNSVNPLIVYNPQLNNVVKYNDVESDGHFWIIPDNSRNGGKKDARVFDSKTLNNSDTQEKGQNDVSL